MVRRRSAGHVWEKEKMLGIITDQDVIEEKVCLAHASYKTSHGSKM